MLMFCAVIGRSEVIMKSKNLNKITLTAIFAALIAVMTAFIKVNTGINDGYLHFGDSMIYLAGCLLGPYAAISAAIGGGLADIIASAAVWALPTAIIKACNSVPFIVATAFYVQRKSTHKIIHISTVLMTVLSGLITVFGYLIAEGLMYSFASAWTSVPFSIIQATGSAIIFIIIGYALDKVKIQKFFM